MSYILDALKKSERQRPPGEVPDLFTVHGPQPPPPRRPTRALVAGALLLAVPAIALWVWVGTDHRDEGPARTPAAASVSRHTGSPAAPVTPRTPAPSTLPEPVRVPAGAAPVARTPVDDRSHAPAPPAQRSHEAASAAPSPLTLPAAPPSVPASASAPATPPVDRPAVIPPVPALVMPVLAVIAPPHTGDDIPPAAAAPEMPAAGIPVADTLTPPEPLPAAGAAEEAPPADGRVLELAELPAVIRADLPKLLVSGHVWSEDRSMRLLSVDDRLLREGGEAAPGVSLREITQTGAVFTFKGWRFRVAGGRP